MPEDIRAMIVIEMMGRPKEHLAEVMKDFLKKLDSEKGIKVIDKKIHKPKVVVQKDEKGQDIKFPEGKEMYSSFSEVEIDIETLMDLVRIVFVYMPSHVEIINPVEFRVANFDISAILSEITKKMHQYDAIAKNAILQNKMLANKLMQMEQALKTGDVIMKDNKVETKKSKAKKSSKKKKR